MLAVHRVCRGSSLLVLCVAGCDRSHPLAPAVEAAYTGAAGPTVKSPSNTNAVAVSESRIDVTWRDNSSNETGLELHRSTTGTSGVFTLLASTAAGVTSHRDDRLTAARQYCYKVLAFKRADGKTGYSGFSNSACATTQPLSSPPAAPSDPDVRPESSSVIVRWIDNSTNEDGFRVQRSADLGATWTIVSTVAPNGTFSRDDGRPIELPFCYRLIAFNAQGDSPPSNTDCTAQPAAPSALTGAGVSGPAIELTWTDNSALEDGFVVERRGSGIIATLPANATSYRHLGVSPDVPYGYVVRATKDGGFSGNSNFVVVVVGTVPPAAPSGANAVPSGSAVARVTWIDNATNESGFRVERSTDGGASWVAAGTAGLDEMGFYDVGQASEQPLCYRVIAFNSQGDSPPSNTDCTTLPAVPSPPLVTLVEGPAFDLTWADNSGIEDGYEVQRLFCDWDMCHDWESIATLGPNATSYRDAALWQFAYGYYYRIFALKDGGRSDPSGEAFVMMTP
jgi:hypothetical protein